MPDSVSIRLDLRDDDDFKLYVPTKRQTVVQGSDATYVVETERLGELSDEVDIDVGLLQEGISYEFNQDPIGAGGSAILTIDTTGMETGTHYIDITADYAEAGNIFYAESISRTDVLAAINAAGDGDTVSIPAGDSTWASGIVLPTDRALTIIGQGSGSSIIRTSTGVVVFTIGTQPHSLGYLEIENGIINFDNGKNFRLHHLKMYSATTYTGLTGRTTTATPVLPYGVIDNCDITNMRILAHGTAYMLPATQQHQLWAMDSPLGMAGDGDVVYIEDCTFYHSPSLIDLALRCTVDSGYGGRFVFRYNTVTNGWATMHGTGQAGYMRGARSWEIYENDFIYEPGGAENKWTQCWLRGGTGVCFNNTFTGAVYPIILHNNRDQSAPAGCGQCNGTSDWDENTEDESGWACRDQIGRGKDTVLWVEGEEFTQESAPAYFWNNVDGNEDPVTIYFHQQATPPHIVLNRDYYLTAKPGYTAYTYPHPLRGE